MPERLPTVYIGLIIHNTLVKPGRKFINTTHIVLIMMIWMAEFNAPSGKNLKNLKLVFQLTLYCRASMPSLILE